MRYFLQNIPGDKHGFNKYHKGLISVLFLIISNIITGQTVHDSLPYKVTLSQCISYALANQSLIKQSEIDEDITKRDIRIALSGWYPQLEADANVQHYFQIPIANYPNLNNPPQYTPYISLPSTATNISSGIFSVNQTLYSNNIFFAARTSKQLRNQASENTENSKINTYVDVTKAFFDVLLTEEQLHVLDEDILRLQRNYKDAYSLYKNGLTDKIDYQRTEISLSNTQAQRKSAGETLKAKYSILKQFMGVVPEKQLAVTYDSSRFENEILIDTTKNLNYNNRIEYQLLQTAINLQGSEISYYKWSFLPTLSAFYDYNTLYGNNQFSELYNKNNSSSLLGLKLTLPLFQGMNRMENLSKAKLQYQRLQLGMEYLKSGINSEYTLALSRYTSNLNELRTAKNNIAIAKNIFNTVKLQYDNGVKAYLEVIVSETDLRTAELNYLNVLFQVLSSKVDFEKASGVIIIN
ncbi:MAG: TolC family protein [Bacteroidia bacterium]|nr:TolC family protein [Bacteroidia bacterium]